MISDEEITVRKGELMLPHECTMKGQYITVRTAIIAVFTIMAPITTGLSYFVSNNSASLNSQIQLQLLPMIEKDRACLARIIRLENNELAAKGQREESLIILREIKTDLKYNFVTKKEFEKELDLKVDMDKMNKQYLNKN